MPINQENDNRSDSLFTENKNEVFWCAKTRDLQSDPGSDRVGTGTGTGKSDFAYSYIWYVKKALFLNLFKSILKLLRDILYTVL